MKIDSLKDVEKYLELNRVRIDKVKDSYELDRIKSLLDKLNNPQDKIKTIHIAGTSGKTSTCYYVAELLSANGYKTGLTISPHITSLNERVQVNSTALSEKEFCKNIEEFINTIEKFKIKFTYFEFLIAFSFWYFAKIKVDYAVVEVGLGGLLDGTNVVSREDKICVITDIGLDHMGVLGNTIDEITLQKAGIIQNGNRVFCNRQEDNIMTGLRRVAKAKNAELFINPEEEFATFKDRNFSLAKLVTSAIFRQDGKTELSENQLDKARTINIPGRMERYVLGEKTIILDGAHNSQKMDNLVKSLENEFSSGSCCFVLALGENKQDQLLKISQTISKFAHHVILTGFRIEQDFVHTSLTPGYLKSYFENVSAEKATDLDEAVEKALSRPEETIIFTGSLYMIGTIKSKLGKLKAE